MIFGIIAAPVILAAVFVFDVFYRQEKLAIDEAVARAQGLARTLAASSTDHLLALETLPRSLAGYPGLLHSAILTPKGLIIAHTDPERVTEYVDANLLSEDREWSAGGIVMVNDAFIIVSRPILSGGKHVGWAQITMSKHKVTASVSQSAKMAALYALVVISAGLLFGLHITRGLSRRLSQMVDVANSVAAGSAIARIEVSRQDELGELGLAFNEMADRVARREAELQVHRDQLEDTVKARTGQLQTEIAERKAAQEELTRSEERVRQIVNSAGDGIVSLNERGEIVIFNTTAQKMFGYSAFEAIGQNVKMLMPAAAALNHDANVTKFAEQSNSYVLGDKRRIYATRKDGSEFPVEIAVSTMYLGDQRVFTAIVRDISERIAAEDQQREFLQQLNEKTKQLTESEARLRRLLDISPSGISVVSRETGKRLYSNNRFLDMFAAKDSEELDAFGVPNTYAQVEDWRRVDRDFKSGTPIHNLIIERCRVNGERWWVQLDAIPLIFEGELSVVIWHHDITDRIAAEDQQKEMVRQISVSTEKLKESEESLRRIFESAPAGVVTLRIGDGKRLYANPRLLEMFGVQSLEELNNFGFAGTYVREEDWNNARAVIQSGRAPERFIMERKRVNGERWWAFLDAVPMELNGQQTLVVWHTDVTEQKTAEAELANTLVELNASRDELQTSEKRLRDILDSSPSGIAVVDSDTGKRVYVNDQMLEMLGAESLEQLQQFDMAKTFASEAEFRTALAHLRDPSGVSRFVIERRKLDGTPWWALTDFVPVTYMGKRAIIVWHHDITEKTNADAELSRLLNSAPVGVAIIGQEFGERLYTNKKYLELFGAETPAQLRDFGYENTFVSKSDFEFAQAHFNRKTGIETAVMQRRRINGEEWWAKVYAVPVDFRNIPTFIIWCADITDQKQAEAKLVQSEKLASLGGLVAGVAHEVNTPIGISVTAITHLQERSRALGKLFETAEMTKSDLVSFLDVADQSCTIISSNLKRAADLVRSFKQVAVDQSSEGVRIFDLLDYIEEIMLSLAPQMKKKPGISVSIESDGPIMLESYPGPVAQVVTNLVMNSIVHGFPGTETGKITIGLMSESDHIHLIYKDNGRGIAPENVNRVFDPFFTTNRSAGGSGLGMHIVYNLITQKLGGTIDCQSKLGQGVRFDIRVPLRPGDPL